MANLTDTQILDITATTMKWRKKMSFGQIATELQNYEVMGKLQKLNGITVEGGDGIERPLIYRDNGAASMVGLYNTDNYNVIDVMIKVQAPWRQSNTFWGWDRREALRNRGTPKLVDLIQVRRVASKLSLAQLMEDEFWGKPADSTDELSIWGLLYWIVKSTADTTGFTGTGLPSGFTTVGGLVPGTYNWINYSHRYTGTAIGNITKANVIDPMRTAYRKIKFKSPVDIPSFRKGVGQRYRIYTTETGIRGMENIGESQNENLGRDVASMDDTTVFRKNPIIWIPQLDADTSNPFYMLDLAKFYPVVLSGDNMREASPKFAPTQHNVVVVDVDLSWNVVCDDRRAQAVIYGGG